MQTSVNPRGHSEEKGLHSSIFIVCLMIEDIQKVYLPELLIYFLLFLRSLFLFLRLILIVFAAIILHLPATFLFLCF